MEGEDLVTKFDAMVKRFKTEFEDIVEGERAKMKAEVDAYNVEKEKMKAVAVNDNDIIHLNVGGQKMTTKRSTLCQVEGSLLASMFSGRWEDGLERDKDGCVFFDFNPHYFGLILDYLRAKKIETPGNPAPFPKIAPEQVKNFRNLVGYLGLQEELARKDSFKSCSAQGITIAEDGAVAIHEPINSHRYVLGENSFREGLVSWQLKFESFKNNGWMLIAIVNVNTSLSRDSSYDLPGTYGWAVGNSNQIYENGNVSHNESLRNLCKLGDTVKLVLDCDRAKLSLVLASGQEFHLKLPESETWRLHINLHGSDDKIRIL